MTTLGMLNLASIVYLAAVISFVFSFNEQREPGRIFKEALRRWIKFMVIVLIIGAIVTVVDR
jgi:hypothetical protein